MGHIVLVRHPRAFSGYLIASPSIWATPALVDEVRRMPPLTRPTRVFIGYGDGETLDIIGPSRRFAEALAKPGAGLEVRETAFEGQNHLSSFLMEIDQQTMERRYSKMLGTVLTAGPVRHRKHRR